MKKQKALKTGAAVAAMLTALSASCAGNVLTASAAGSEAFPYTMFAASEADGALTVNAKHFCLNGSVATNGTVQAAR